MAAAKKKGKKAGEADPISERERALNDQISSLEAEIKRLDTQIQHTPTPKLRSTAIPHSHTVSRKAEPAPAKPVATEPVFEEIRPLKPRTETEAPDHFNELGVRKYDLPALLQKVRDQFRRPTTNNPRLVNYLAAGGVHGLRPLRYEKRVARNRFVAFTVVLFLLLLGIILFFARNR
ncbi:MAG TPA: hypothetical protein VNU95_01930 [Candidatus Acidoferrales bacterium]|jgi:hypothetical protein|nr:hypothetical protein [Candidatus Acidoferrales bacterium]